ncbi:hypothetical protein BDF19DRAFT_384353 [Syncephalis fuscata]|nr:hypothetical protein BDF19DRAFT_384353 [Syncephalis fuscata]
MEQAVCECQKAEDNTSRGCVDDTCFNRMMFYECSPKLCGCGNLCSNQRFRRHEFVKELEVFGTMNRGFGLRTKVPLQAGQLITEYCGEVITQRTCLERMNTIYHGHHNFYFLECGHGRVIDAGRRGTDARFANHSCEPNCHIEKWFVDGELRIGLFATAVIEAGTELTYDYNYESMSGMEEPCYCGSPRCRGVIGQRNRIPNNACLKKGDNKHIIINGRTQRKSVSTTRHQQQQHCNRQEVYSAYN